MALSIVCPKCSKTSLFTDSDLGKKLRCNCGAEFFLEGVVGEKLPAPRTDSAADDGALVSSVMARRLPDSPPPPPQQATASSVASDAVPIPPEQAAKELQLRATGKPADVKLGDAKPATVAPMGVKENVAPNPLPSEGSGFGWVIGFGIVVCVLVIAILLVRGGSSHTESTPSEKKTVAQAQVGKQGQPAQSSQAAPPVRPEQPVQKDVATESGREILTEQDRLEKYNAAVARMNRHAEAGEWKEALGALDEASQVGVLMTRPPMGFESLAVKRKVMEGLAGKPSGETGGATGTGTPVVAVPQSTDKAEATRPATAAEVKEAVLPPFNGLSVDAQPGVVVVNCLQPEKIPYFVPVRIEIQRGGSPDRFDTKVHSFELPSEGVAVKTADTAKKTDATDEKNGTTARSVRRQPASTTTKTAKDDKGKVRLPYRFEDLGVITQTAYYYRARLVARLETPGKEVTLRVPDSVEKIRGSDEGVTLYASPWSPVEKVTVPASFQLRLNFVNGTVPSDPRAPQVGYSAFLGVRLWDTEARAWGESSFEVPVGQPVGGTLKLKVGTLNKVREFDAGLVLDSVRTATRFEVRRVKEPVMETKTDENGQAVSVVALDASKQPKFVERLVPRRSPTQVAVLREGNTEKIRLVKGMGYEEQLPPGVKILLEGEAEPNIEQMPKAQP